jgi:hypothetical protein
MSDATAATPPTQASVIGEARHVRWGLATLGLAGALFFVGYLTAGPFVGEMLEPATFVDTFGPRRFQAGMVVNMLAMIVSFFGFFALYAYLTGSGQRRAGVVGLVLATVGNGLLLAVMAVPMALIPTAANRYADSPAEAVAIVEEVFTGPVVMTIFMATTLLLTVALVVYAVGLWRERRLPRAAVGLLAVGYLFLTNAHFAAASIVAFVVDLAGGAAMAAGGFWLAYAAGGLTPHSMTEGSRSP